jgi:hypothetical protein
VTFTVQSLIVPASDSAIPEAELPPESSTPSTKMWFALPLIHTLTPEAELLPVSTESTTRM